MQYDWRQPDTGQYGIVHISVANIRRLPVHQAELMDQAVLGTILAIFEEQNGFYYIRNWDGYYGWVTRHSVVATDRAGAEKWSAGSRIVFRDRSGYVRAMSSARGEILADLVPCALLQADGREEAFIRVILPDGRRGYVDQAACISEAEQSRLPADRNAVALLARQFSGIPYVWGGASTKGFDCSGFVQTVYRLQNVPLPRDARQMAECGSEIPFSGSFDHLKSGDLLFFGKTLRRITHVAIYLQDGLYIHAEGYVRRNSLGREHPLYNPERRETLLRVQRILDD